MRAFTKRPGISKWETDSIKMRIYDPVYYEQHMKHQQPSLFSSVSYIIDDKRKVFGKILEQYEINRASYRGPEQTSSGQDMSYWIAYRERLMNDYKEKALNDIRNEVSRLITNCKNILTHEDFDMFEEFKNIHPNSCNYFNLKLKDIQWDSYDKMPSFIDCVIACVLSQEAIDKLNEKVQKSMKIRHASNEARRTLLYKKEFECEKLFAEIVKYKLKSPELYVEYKKITELKSLVLDIFGKHPDIDNHPFIKYFTEDKKKYINGLIELLLPQQQPKVSDCELLPFVSFSHDDDVSISDTTNDTKTPTIAATGSDDGNAIAYQCKKYGIVNFSKLKDDLIEKYFVKEPAVNNIFITVNEIAN